MTALRWAAVVEAIAALDIRSELARIAVIDVHELPQALTNRDLPLLAPAVDRAFLSDWTSTRISFQGNTQHVYTLNYALFQAPFAKGRGMFEPFDATVTNLTAVVDAIQGRVRVDGCKRIEVAGIPQVGLVGDGSDLRYHGGVIALRVHEY